MARIERFEEIEAWQSARELTRMVYAASRRGRFANDFRFCSQIQAANRWFHPLPATHSPLTFQPSTF